MVCKVTRSIQTYIENKGQRYNANRQDNDDEVAASQFTDFNLGGVVIPQDEILKADLLRISAIEGPDISKDVILEINACGLRNSLRKRNDGCTIIGSQMYNENGEVVNDYVMN